MTPYVHNTDQHTHNDANHVDQLCGGRPRHVRRQRAIQPRVRGHARKQQVWHLRQLSEHSHYLRHACEKGGGDCVCLSVFLFVHVYIGMRKCLCVRVCVCVCVCAFDSRSGISRSSVNIPLAYLHA